MLVALLAPKSFTLYQRLEIAYLSHSVGLGAMHDLGRGWADGGVSSHDLGGIGDIVIAVVCVRTCHEGNGSSNDG